MKFTIMSNIQSYFFSSTHHLRLFHLLLWFRYVSLLLVFTRRLERLVQSSRPKPASLPGFVSHLRYILFAKSSLTHSSTSPFTSFISCFASISFIIISLTLLLSSPSPYVAPLSSPSIPPTPSPYSPNIYENTYSRYSSLLSPHYLHSSPLPHSSPYLPLLSLVSLGAPLPSPNLCLGERALAFVFSLEVEGGVGYLVEHRVRQWILR